MFWCTLKIIFIFILMYFSNIESIKMISGNLWTIMNFIYIFIIPLTSHQFPSSVQLEKKMCKSSLFSKTTPNISITFVMNFFIALLENIYIKTKRSSNEVIFWENRENGLMEGEYWMVRTGPCFHSPFLDNLSIYMAWWISLSTERNSRTWSGI